MNFFKMLSENSYPGRGIALGRSADGGRSVLVYFIMGRSENSRNRIFEETIDGIRTKAFDEAKMRDPSLIIYHPVRVMDSGAIVTNGDQTDTIRDTLLSGGTFADALRKRAFEPDSPNWTPRISGILTADGAYTLSILKAADADGSSCQRFFFEYGKPLAGHGHFISTYESDGKPLPSFQGEPRSIALGDESARELAERIWTALNGDNKVSLFVRTVELQSGKIETAIINRYV